MFWFWIMDLCDGWISPRLNKETWRLILKAMSYDLDLYELWFLKWLERGKDI